MSKNRLQKIKDNYADMHDNLSADDMYTDGALNVDDIDELMRLAYNQGLKDSVSIDFRDALKKHINIDSSYPNVEGISKYVSRLTIREFYQSMESLIKQSILKLKINESCSNY